MRLPLKPVLRTALVATILGTAGASFAADAGRPLVLAQMDDDTAAPPADPSSSIAAMTVRMDRLENTVRQLTGQVEELQFQNRKLTDDLRKMQQDVDFRFQDLNRGSGNAGLPPARPAAPSPGKRSDLDVPVGTGLPADASGVDPAPKPDTGLRTRRAGDAFDPAANPNAPGAPRQLGTTPPSAPLGTRSAAAEAAPNAPLDLMRHPGTPSIIDDSTENGVAAIPRTPEAAAPAVIPAPNPSAMASLAPGGTRDEYNADLDLYKQGQYDGAATGLKAFLDKYPRDKMVPDAVYLLGESYTKLGRHREAAEQYLRLSTDFGKAPRAPDALLRLGMSLNAMGVREQACATYQEVTRRFPTASPDLRASVDRELKRARC